MKYSAHIRVFDRDELLHGEAICDVNDYISEDGFNANTISKAVEKALDYAINNLRDEETIIINVHLTNGPCVLHSQVTF